MTKEKTGMFVFTSCINNYIPKARVLASSLKALHPDWTFCLLLGEEPPEGFSLEGEPFDRVLRFDQLGIPDFPSWLFRHRVVEICTAAKGPALYHFLVREQHDKVMYLDPDIMVFNSLTPLAELLDTHDLLLTPHQLEPQEGYQSLLDNEMCSMKYGVFNLGFVAAARRGDGIAFAGWWRKRLLEFCYDDIPNGIFTDQRWCDLAPAFFAGLHVVRDPGCDVASWNLAERTVTHDADGVFLVNGVPLRFYHFTGYDSGAGQSMTARYGGDMPAVDELWKLYRDRLIACGQNELGKLSWRYAAFGDGTPVPDDMRIAYRDSPELRHLYPDPFSNPGRVCNWKPEVRRTRETKGQRFRRKLRSELRKAGNVLKERGTGAFIRYVLRKSRDEIGRTVRKIRRCRRKHAPESAPLPPRKEILPPLHNLLADTDGPLRLLRAEADAVSCPATCIVEHDWGGGAGAYCEARVRALLENGHNVIRLRYVSGTGIVMTACSGGRTFRCRVEELSELKDERFPRITNLIIHELAGWHFEGWHAAAACAGVQRSVRDLAGIARFHKAHVEFLFHDYYSVCPTIFLMTPDGIACEPDEKAGDDCDVCALRGRPFSMRLWRRAWQELLCMADRVVFFSEDTRTRVEKIYSLRGREVTVLPHAVEPFKSVPLISGKGPMRIAVVGTIGIHKGAVMVVRLARLLEQRLPDARIIVFGTLESSEIPGNVRVLGSYAREDLPRMLEKEKITAAAFTSVWPETFSYVAHELAELNIPLASFNIGAQGELVSALGERGKLAARMTAEAMLDALLELDSFRQAGVFSRRDKV